MIDAKGIFATPDKPLAMAGIPCSQNVKELLFFLISGTCSFTTILYPLNLLFSAM